MYFLPQFLPKLVQRRVPGRAGSDAWCSVSTWYRAGHTTPPVRENQFSAQTQPDNTPHSDHTVIRPEKLEKLQDNHHVAHAGQSADRDGEFDHDDNVEQGAGARLRSDSCG